VSGWHAVTSALEHVVVGDGCRIAVRHSERADAPTIVFSNSLGTNHTMWSPQIELLAQDYSLVQYDTRGHGASDAPSGAYSIDRLSLDVLEILDALDVARAHFCGVSIGGMTGQRLAWRAPERFESMTLAATSAYMGPAAQWQERIGTVLSQGMSAISDRVLGVWFSPQFANDRPSLHSQVRQIFCDTDPVGYAGCCAAIRDMDQRPTAKLNSLPTLIVAGDADPATPTEHGRFLHDEIKGSQFVVLQGAHLINLASPDAFTDALRAQVEGAS